MVKAEIHINVLPQIPVISYYVANNCFCVKFAMEFNKENESKIKNNKQQQ